MDYYERKATAKDFCTGPIDMRVIVDYRQATPEERVNGGAFAGVVESYCTVQYSTVLLLLEVLQLHARVGVGGGHCGAQDR